MSARKVNSRQFWKSPVIGDGDILDLSDNIPNNLSLVKILVKGRCNDQSGTHQGEEC